MHEIHCRDCDRHAEGFGIVYASKDAGIPFCHDHGMAWLSSTSCCPKCGRKSTPEGLKACAESCGYKGALDRGFSCIDFDRWPIWCNGEPWTFPIWNGFWPGKAQTLA